MTKPCTACAANARLKPVILVKLDLVAERDGFCAGAAISVLVPPVSGCSRDLVLCARKGHSGGD